MFYTKLLFFVDLDKLIDECSSYTKRPTVQKSWTARMEDLGKSWASKRPKIMMSLIEMESLLLSSLCVHCRKDQAHVRCRQCGLKDIMCVKCDDEVHRRNPFHDRDIYYEGFFKPVAPSVSLDSEGNLTTVGK